MTSNIEKFVKKNKNSLIIGAAILLFVAFSNPNTVIPIPSGSIFGDFFGIASVGLVLSTVAFFIGLAMIAVPEPVSTFAGAIIVVISIGLGSLSIFGILNSLISGIPLGTIAIMALVFFVGKNLLTRKKLL